MAMPAWADRARAGGCLSCMAVWYPGPLVSLCWWKIRALTVNPQWAARGHCQGVWGATLIICYQLSSQLPVGQSARWPLHLPSQPLTLGFCDLQRGGLMVPSMRLQDMAVNEQESSTAAAGMGHAGSCPGD